MKNIHRKFRNGEAVYLDDIWFFSCELVPTYAIPCHRFFSKNVTNPEVKQSVSEIKNDFEKTEKRKFEDSYNFSVIQFLKHRYDRLLWENKNEEPLWMRALIDPIARHIRAYWIMAGRSVDQHAICGWFPYTNFSYAVVSRGLVEETFNIARLHRLQGIKQLASLRDTAIREIDINETLEKKVIAMDFNHTRLLHSYDVCALMTLISCNNLHSPEIRDNIRYAKIAGLTHDWRTPAGGDTMKWVDPKSFNEDVHYGELYKAEGWKRFAATHKIDEEYLYDIIQNKGLLGQLLNICDKLAYTSRDVYAFAGALHMYSGEQRDFHFKHSEGYEHVYNEIVHSPCFVDLWKSIRVINGVFATHDPLSYLSFVRIRALMHKHLYLSPVARFPEYLFSQYIWKAMYKRGIITAETLIQKNDSYLFEKTDAFIPNMSYFINSVTNSLPCSFTTYASTEEALQSKQLQESKKEKDVLYFLDHLPKRFKSGLDLMMILKNGELRRIQDLYPSECEKIESICNIQNTAWLYKVNISRLDENTKERLLNLINDDENLG